MPRIVKARPADERTYQKSVAKHPKTRVKSTVVVDEGATA
jgi:hypothetical protein